MIKFFPFYFVPVKCSVNGTVAIETTTLTEIPAIKSKLSKNFYRFQKDFTVILWFFTAFFTVFLPFFTIFFTQLYNKYWVDFISRKNKNVAYISTILSCSQQVGKFSTNFVIEKIEQNRRVV